MNRDTGGYRAFAIFLARAYGADPSEHGPVRSGHDGLPRAGLEPRVNGEKCVVSGNTIFCEDHY